jgi:hypothetical protein
VIFETISIFKAGIFVFPHIGKNHWLLCRSVVKKIIKYYLLEKLITIHHSSAVQTWAGLSQNF